jgi:AraC-like DNA-binding protein
VYDNFSRKLTLSEIAERENLSIYYLSHIIKEATGLSFQDLLSYIRVEESEKLLLGTNKKIGAIAEETGFSAVRYYIKHFEHWFDMHPLEYRKKYSGKTISRSIAAQYERAYPAQIEEAVRKQVKGVYADYVDKLKMKAAIIDVDISSTYGEASSEKPVLYDIMDRKVNESLAGPYSILKEMNERVLVSDDNYVVTTRCRYPEPLTSLSILIYNFDSNISKSLRKILGEEDLLRIVRNYDDETEFLVRCTGLSGDFRIMRYRLERQNFIRKITDNINPEKDLSPRERFINTISAEANVSTRNYMSSDALSVRTIFQGLGAELILIDKI